jgi:hydroxymethylpyrimidine pyrophosphatase-like HAD family hydrolase
VVSPEQAQRALATPRAGLEIAQSTSPLMPDARFVGLTRAGVSKGSAMKTIAAAYRVDMKEVMYVGDAGNDLSALRVVGVPVAMGNADPAVIAAARHTVGHVNAGGLAEAFDLAIASRTM